MSYIVTYAAAVRDVRCHSVAALTFLVWNTFLTFDEEVQCIWLMRNKNPLKWLYFYLRYSVLIAHITHNCLIDQLANSTYPPICNVWRLYLMVFSQSLTTSIKIVLAIRIYALYNRSRRMAFLLLILHLIEIGGAVRMILTESDGFYGICLLLRPGDSSKNQAFVSFTTQCILIVLTLVKCFLATKAGWGRTPLVSLLIRDGSAVYIFECLLLACALIVCGLRHERGIALFFWVTSLYSFYGCYLVMGLERLARKEAPTAPELILTSEVSLGIYMDAGRQSPLPSRVAPLLTD
ncbi:hypothetical protein JVU11DRAFT_10020 [Chiua virens]|nr:hypothetical protein JVU11DRAFT_10020 [Chiua virens]